MALPEKAFRPYLPLTLEGLDSNQNRLWYQAPKYTEFLSVTVRLFGQAVPDKDLVRLANYIVRAGNEKHLRDDLIRRLRLEIRRAAPIVRDYAKWNQPRKVGQNWVDPMGATGWLKRNDKPPGA